MLVSLALTFVALRVTMALSPDSDFDVAGYNVHHLFVGVALIVVAGVPLSLISGRGHWIDLAAVLFGSGLSLALDEWVYLIATDGSNASYLLPVSFWGGVVAVGLACLYVGALLRAGRAARANSVAPPDS